MSDNAALLHGIIEFLLLAVAAHLLGRHVGLHGFRRGFVEVENRGRMYFILAFTTLAALWSQMFPAARRVPAFAEMIGLALAALVFVRSFRQTRGAPSSRWSRGRAFGQFNVARKYYDRAMKDRGYWFENRSNSKHYSDDQSRFLLSESRGILERLRGQLEGNQDIRDRTKLLVGLHWQLASVYCVLGKYDEAEVALGKMRLYLDGISSNEWSTKDRDEYRSKHLFLSGELAYLKGDLDHARQCFNDSRSIDQRLGDAAGTAMNDLRLQLFAEPT